MDSQSGQADFEANFDVSRETIERLAAYETLLRKWNPSINLVSQSTISSLWNRHFVDSAQVLTHTKLRNGHWVDIGTGGGFPGMVVAIICKEQRPDIRFTFVESDIRKSVFLRTVAREVSVPVTVESKRAEDIESLNADVLTARAMAPLPNLLGYAERHLKADGQAIFPKGAKFRQELKDALEFWTFNVQNYPSITDANAAILYFGEIVRV